MTIKKGSKLFVSSIMNFIMTNDDKVPSLAQDQGEDPLLMFEGGILPPITTATSTTSPPTITTSPKILDESCVDQPSLCCSLHDDDQDDDFSMIGNETEEPDILFHLSWGMTMMDDNEEEDPKEDNGESPKDTSKEPQDDGQPQDQKTDAKVQDLQQEQQQQRQALLEKINRAAMFLTNSNTATSKRGGNPKKSCSSMPKRPLSAYNIFFKAVRRQLILNKQYKGLGFAGLGRQVGQRWKTLSYTERAIFEALAEQDSQRYAREMKEYKQQCKKNNNNNNKTDTQGIREEETNNHDNNKEKNDSNFSLVVAKSDLPPKNVTPSMRTRSHNNHSGDDPTNKANPTTVPPSSPRLSYPSNTTITSIHQVDKKDITPSKSAEASSNTTVVSKDSSARWKGRSNNFKISNLKTHNYSDRLIHFHTLFPSAESSKASVRQHNHGKRAPATGSGDGGVDGATRSIPGRSNVF